MKKKEPAPAGAEKMTDTELSKKLGRCQKWSALWYLLGLIGVVSGLIVYFAVPDPMVKSILVAVLFGGCCCAVILSTRARKKLDALVQEQLGDFFRAELEKTFGSDLHTEKMRIDEALVKALHLSDGKWEECRVERLHEGERCGVHFSAANVQLNHVYEIYVPREGSETRRDVIFKGLVLRCETRIPALSAICVNARTEDSPRGIVTENEEFDHRFCVTAEREADAHSLLTPQYMDFLMELDRGVEGRLLALCLAGSVLSLAIETDYGFAAVAGYVDMSSLDAVKKSYTNTLHAMGQLLDLLRESPALSGAAE